MPGQTHMHNSICIFICVSITLVYFQYFLFTQKIVAANKKHIQHNSPDGELQGNKQQGTKSCRQKADEVRVGEECRKHRMQRVLYAYRILIY